MKNISRRNFISKAAGAAAAGVFLPTLIPSSALGKAGTVAPSNRINVAFIGHGMQSGGHRGDMARNPRTQILSVCDVKLDVLDRVYGEVERINKDRGIGNSLQKTIHYQEALDRDDIDAAFIVTPDHWHVAISLYAILRQARLLRKAAYFDCPRRQNFVGRGEKGKYTFPDRLAAAQ